MTLNNFEQQLNKVQLTKGLDYFESGCISELEEWETGVWNAIVAGSKDYHVKIALKKGTIEKSYCDCPHDAEYCKHIIAVLYAIKEERGVLPDKTNIKSTSAKGIAKKLKDAIGEMVNKIPEKDLRRFVVDHAETDCEFRNMLVAHFSSSFSESGSHLYAEIIKNAARTAGDRHGFIDYYNAAKAIQPVYLLLQKADTAFGQGHYSVVADIAFAVIENVHDMMTGMDDSSGSAGDCIKDGFELLARLCQADIPFDLKEQIFKEAEREAKNKKYDYAGFDDYWLDILVHAACDSNKQQQLLQLIDKMLSGLARDASDWTKEFNTRRLLGHKISLLRRMDRNAEADALRLRHLDIDDLRMELIEEKLEKKEYSAARQLIEEDIGMATKKDHPGTVVAYKERLLRIARELKDITSIRSVARELYAGRNMEYYKIIKQTYNAQEWPAIAEDLIKDLQKLNKPIPGFRGTINGEALAAVFIEEGYWNRLLELLQQNPRLEFIESYSGLLTDKFPEELLHVYKETLINYAEQNTGRTYYVTIRKVLKKMQGWNGGQVMVKQLTDEFILRYKARKAMIEELGNL
ncbi:MAG: SWIM zinc finger family protein [Puia sp.]|nr:SWIM zinc finger family protein [Puia sp.]